MIFILLSSGMIALAAALVAVPLWRARLRPSPSTQAANQDIYAARREELERDVASGRLAAEDFDAAQRDLERELVPAAATSSPEPVRIRSARWAAAVAAGAIIATCLGLYLKVGNWQPAVEGVHAASVPKVEQMVTEFARRLSTTDPNDLQGWIMLGRSYVLMGKYRQALNAFNQARHLSHDRSAGALAGYAEALTLQDPSMVMTRAAPLFEQVLKLDPRNAEGLWYGGLIAFARGDKPLAIQRWQTLLTENPPENFRKLIVARIQAAGGTIPAAAVPAGKVIAVQVTLDPALRSKVSPDETLFVFAEPVGQSSGPPLAMRRFQVRDLPLRVTLSDTDAMLSGRKLSDYAAVIIIARISPHGNPLPQSGDLMGQGRWQENTAKAVHIRINQSVP